MDSGTDGKRLWGDEEDRNEGEGQWVKRQRTSSNGVEEAAGRQSREAFCYFIEPFLRKVVREEVEKSFLCYMNTIPRTCFYQLPATAKRRWRLHFKKKLPSTLFAGSRIEADDGFPVEIAILDTFSNSIVTSGRLSALKIEILVLDGDFGGDDQEDWTDKEFSDRLIREREGKRPLLTGDLSIPLRGGIGCFGDLTFTDNSSWVRSRKFRLGARVIHEHSDSKVREAISGAFVVKDHRGELYKKHHPPLLNDEVWRLEKIGKDGVFHRRLSEKGIDTVQDFLRLLVVNQERLRMILGSGMSNKTWETTVQHALNCQVENKPYFYYDDVSHQVRLYFNSILEVVGVKLDGACYQAFSNLSVQLQAAVSKLKEIAYGNQNNIALVECLPAILPQSLLAADAICSPSSDIGDLPYPCTPIMSNDELSTKCDFKHLEKPSFELHGNQFQLEETDTSQVLHPVERYPSAYNIPTKAFPGEPLQDCLTKLLPRGWDGSMYDPLAEKNSAFRMLDYMPFSSDTDVENGHFHVSGNELRDHHKYPFNGFDPCLVASSKWRKLMATLKCGMLIRKRLAAKRRASAQRSSFQTFSAFQDSLFHF